MTTPRKSTAKKAPAKKASRSADVPLPATTRGIHPGGEGSADEDTLQAVVAAMETQSEVFTKQSQETKDALLEATAKENEVFKRRNRLLIILLSIVLILAVIREARSIFETGPLLTNMKNALEGIEDNQGGIDELVTFVRDIQEQTCVPSEQPTGTCPPNETEQAVGAIISLLCSSEDDVRAEACRQLGFTPVQNQPKAVPFNGGE